MHFSAVDVLIFVVAAGVIMAYHAWFFISTTVWSDRAAAAEEQARSQAALEAALARGDAVLLSDYRSARPRPHAREEQDAAGEDEEEE